jgi:hypothetical protein
MPHHTSCHLAYLVSQTAKSSFYYWTLDKQ